MVIEQGYVILFHGIDNYQRSFEINECLWFSSNSDIFVIAEHSLLSDTHIVVRSFDTAASEWSVRRLDDSTEAINEYLATLGADLRPQDIRLAGGYGYVKPAIQFTMLIFLGIVFLIAVLFALRVVLRRSRRDQSS
ncbi:MAG: hypothetical protein NCW75_13895 [Phycisphaera sp.]|nr:MAG: hypothetical protein NCW75_13895 [Phycisphaera sp.]